MKYSLGRLLYVMTLVCLLFGGFWQFAGKHPTYWLGLLDATIWLYWFQPRIGEDAMRDFGQICGLSVTLMVFATLILSLHNYFWKLTTVKET